METNSVLVEADKLVNGDRQAAYGRPITDFTRTGRFWGEILKIGRDVTAEEVALCMVALKLSRQINKSKRDNLVDIAGYVKTYQLVEEDRFALTPVPQWHCDTCAWTGGPGAVHTVDASGIHHILTEVQ